MKYRHNTRQNQPIVNAIDNTSDVFLYARTLAPPVYAAGAQVTTVCTRQSVTLQRKYLNEQLPFTSESTTNRFGGYGRPGPTECKRPKMNGFEKIGVGI